MLRHKELEKKALKIENVRLTINKFRKKTIKSNKL